VIRHTDGRTVRKVLATVATMVLAAGALAATGVPAQAGPNSWPTFVTCADKPNKGRFYAVMPAGPGKVLVIGSVKPCRPPTNRDMAVIAELNEREGFVAEGPSKIYYKKTKAGIFARVVGLNSRTKRVCLADTPDSALDCYAVRVPVRNGKLGAPIVNGRTTIANVHVTGVRGLCGTCW
jgi:hypothetical protein